MSQPHDKNPIAYYVTKDEVGDPVDFIRIKMWVDPMTQLLDLTPQDALLLIGELARVLRVRESGAD